MVDAQSALTAAGAVIGLLTPIYDRVEKAAHRRADRLRDAGGARGSAGESGAHGGVVTTRSSSRGSWRTPLVMAGFFCLGLTCAALWIANNQGLTQTASPPRPTSSPKSVPPRVTAKMVHARARAGAYNEVHGLVSDGRPSGCRVRLQRLISGSWADRPAPTRPVDVDGTTFETDRIGHYSVDASGAFSVLANPPAPGTYSYRVVAPACGRHRALTGSVFTITAVR